MLSCLLLLGNKEDHEDVEDYGIYVMKNRNKNVQALPRYLIQFDSTPSHANKELRGMLNLNSEPLSLISAPYESMAMARMTCSTTLHLLFKHSYDLSDKSNEQKKKAIEELLSKYSLGISNIKFGYCSSLVFLDDTTPCSQMVFSRLNKSSIRFSDNCSPEEAHIRIPTEDDFKIPSAPVW